MKRNTSDVYVLHVVSHIQRVGCQPEELLYTVANPVRGAEQGKENKIKSLAVYNQPGQYASSIGKPNDANIIMAEMRQMVVVWKTVE